MHGQIFIVSDCNTYKCTSVPAKYPLSINYLYQLSDRWQQCIQILLQTFIKKITKSAAYLKLKITLNFSMESREKISQAASISLPIMLRMDSCSISKWCSWSLNCSLASFILLKWSSSLLIRLSWRERGKIK